MTIEYGNHPIFIIYYKNPDREIRIYANGIVEGDPLIHGIFNAIEVSKEDFRYYSKDWKSYGLPTSSFRSSSSPDSASQGSARSVSISEPHIPAAKGEK